MCVVSAHPQDSALAKGTRAGQTGTMDPQLPPRELGLCTFLLIRLQCIRPWSKPLGPEVSAPVMLVIVSMEEGAGGRT